MVHGETITTGCGPTLPWATGLPHRSPCKPSHGSYPRQPPCSSLTELGPKSRSGHLHHQAVRTDGCLSPPAKCVLFPGSWSTERSSALPVCRGFARLVRRALLPGHIDQFEQSARRVRRRGSAQRRTCISPAAPRVPHEILRFSTSRGRAYGRQRREPSSRRSSRLIPLSASPGRSRQSNLAGRSPSAFGSRMARADTRRLASGLNQLYVAHGASGEPRITSLG